MFKFCCLSWKTNVHQEFRTATSATHGCSAEYLQNKFAKIPGNYLPAATYLFKVKNNRRMCQIRSKLTIKTSRWHHWHCSGVFIVKTERTLSWCFLSWLYIYILLIWNWDSLNEKLNCHYKAWSYKKKGLKTYREAL